MASERKSRYPASALLRAGAVIWGLIVAVPVQFLTQRYDLFGIPSIVWGILGVALIAGAILVPYKRGPEPTGPD